jgi:tRNA pseudouridine38-40 synthase
MTDDATTNIKLTIEYDGTAYHGWQRQPNGPSIQEEIEKALAVMMRCKVTLIGSGRTDAGVHALGQTANFKCETRIPVTDLHKGLNSLLPDDIVIRKCTKVSFGFHARYDVKSKIYQYVILNQPIPAAMGRNYRWWIRTPLDATAMNQALGHLRGEHDFKAFEGAGSPRAHTIRHIMQAQWRHDSEGRLVFTIEANGFLRYMVRNIVGTLVLVGRGKMAERQVADILASRDRNLAGATAPPQGLCLMEVRY